ncbi:MAG: glycosyl transferase [Clostridia bacterium]|nr:glycosyl transferase [Clostridia bacterium]
MGKIISADNLKFLPDVPFLKLKYRVAMKKKLNLKNPVTYNEKLQWLKLHDRKPIYTEMVDKYEAKRYVAERIGEEYIIKTLGVWDHFDDIDFDKLPDRFVLKCTHDSGGLVIVKDKNNLDKAAAKEKIEKCLKRNFYYAGREWPYKNVKPRVLAEEYMEDSKTEELRDYKFFAFNGKVKALFIASERQKENEETKFDFFDAEYNHLPVRNGHPNAEVPPEKPENFEKMKKLAEKLSEGIPHLRVDFYEVDGKIYFGELTFSHWSGMVPFEPEEWDKTFGDWIELPKH